MLPHSSWPLTLRSVSFREAGVGLCGGERGGGRPGSEMMSSVSQGKGERLSVIRDGGIFGGCCVCVK